MPDRFRHKYRIPSARLQSWNYSSNGYYFITICTQNRGHFFGEIANDEMQLSEIGKIVKEYWLKIRNHFPFVVLDEFVVMPNHIHGIVVIKNDDNNDVETPKLGVSTNMKQNNKINHWGNGCLGVIINQYKRICTINIGGNCNFFAWQPRFYDHIIRDEQSLHRIREYIQKNPKNWEKDRNRPDNFVPPCNLQFLSLR